MFAPTHWRVSRRRLHVALLKGTLRRGVCVTLCMAAVVFWWARPAFPVVVDGVSMEPTYRNGERIWATGWLARARVRPGDVIVIRGPSEDLLVKRVALTAGDHSIEINVLDKVWMPLLQFPHLAQRADVKTYLTNRHMAWRPVYVPPGYVYVLGDNTLNSKDSREFGCLPVAEIKGILLDQRNG